MDLARRKLGIMLSTNPEHPNLHTLIQLSGTALERRADVYLYLIDDAVSARTDPRSKSWFSAAPSSLSAPTAASGAASRSATRTPSPIPAWWS